ncbi:hypothetical protein PoB_000027200 [Plakobranchus ocellatus]|uniref:Uncharacterized protein n=1 Tax=Plakobranchus ocellatus TaxID=259542 RepID=A0AAV3XUB1_9GAST|nr:hypothetical protein PoB_000027200 [Plakobranchus ocellatus]
MGSAKVETNEKTLLFAKGFFTAECEEASKLLAGIHRPSVRPGRQWRGSNPADFKVGSLSTVPPTPRGLTKIRRNQSSRGEELDLDRSSVRIMDAHAIKWYTQINTPIQCKHKECL